MDSGISGNLSFALPCSRARTSGRRYVPGQDDALARGEPLIERDSRHPRDLAAAGDDGPGVPLGARDLEVGEEVLEAARAVAADRAHAVAGAAVTDGERAARFDRHVARGR